MSLPPTGLELVERRLDELRDALHRVLEDSEIYYDDPNAGDSGVVFIGWNVWHWKPLPADAAPKVGAARDALRAFHEFAISATKAAPDARKSLKKVQEPIARLIEQPNGGLPNGPPRGSIEAIIEYADEKIEECRSLCLGLPSAHGQGEFLLVADTSALLDRPDLQNWSLDVATWTLVLMPQVLSELDERKRDPRTRDAAQKVINQIDDLDRRGDTLTGVRLAGKVMFREIPYSPDMTETLPWLRSDVPDDVIIAGALDLVWKDLTSRVAIAASDRNVRNKARVAGLGTMNPNAL